jgi:hypothetical protein
MTDAAIIQAEYVEWKMVKTRKALQLIFEVPLEHQAMVQAALGTPMPDTSTPVAIARMMTVAQLEKGIDALAPAEKRGSLAQQAGILCNDPAFQRFMGERVHLDLAGAEATAVMVREYCGIHSRSELDSDEAAAAKFRDLRADFKLWMGGEG